MPYRIRDVPSAFTGEQATWLRELVQTVNALPTFSFFSGLTPQSVVTGQAGDWSFNVGGSVSTNSLAFVKIGPTTSASKVSWARVSMLTLS